MTTTQIQRKYRATFILDTRDYQEPVEALIEKIKTTLEGDNAKVLEMANHGQREFARVTDRAFPAGIYVSFDLEAEPTFTKYVQERFRLEKTVNRILVESI